jgi:hypothetical protein
MNGGLPMEALILVATLGGPTMFARIGALNLKAQVGLSSARTEADKLPWSCEELRFRYPPDATHNPAHK